MDFNCWDRSHKTMVLGISTAGINTCVKRAPPVFHYITGCILSRKINFGKNSARENYFLIKIIYYIIYFFLLINYLFYSYTRFLNRAEVVSIVMSFPRSVVPSFRRSLVPLFNHSVVIS